MRSHATRQIEASLDLRLVVPHHAPLRVPARLTYTPSDPYAVRLDLSTGADRGTVSWVFARQLLLDGVIGATGEGDVHVWPVNGPSSTVVVLSLSSPSGSALFEMDTATLNVFLHRSLMLVPKDSESMHVDIDAELAVLLT